MADTTNAEQKTSAESLVLRGAPRRIVRFKRKLVIGSAGTAALALLTVTALALQSPAAQSKGEGQEVFNVDNKTVADAVADLPKDYTGTKQVPQLGEPVPGDLGRTMVAHERGYTAATASSYGASEEENQARAERLRRLQQARQAKEASVFFPLAQSKGSAGGQQMAQAGAGPGEGYRGAGNGGDDGRLSFDLEGDQNNQQRKLNFLNQAGQRGIYNPYVLQDAVSPYQVMAGSIIAASLITGINSDLPGNVVAQITENVFDTVSGKYLLIPQGSRLIGSYDSVVAFGQNRALLVWQRIVMPDGSSIQIENLPATDASGYAGLADKVDFHTWRLLRGVVLSTLLGVGTELSLGSDEGDLVRAIRESTQQNINRAGQRITEKNLNLQPTITIRPATPLRIIVHKDLIIRPFKG